MQRVEPKLQAMRQGGKVRPANALPNPLLGNRLRCRAVLVAGSCKNGHAGKRRVILDS